MNRLSEIHSELSKWWECLPEDVIGKDLTSESAISRPQVHLILEFYAVRMFTGRAFIRPPMRDPNGISNTSPQSSDSVNGTSSRRARIRALLVDDCVEAAIACIDTCRTIRATITLARASYTEFSALRAALLVVTAQCLQNRAGRFRLALRDGIAMLKEMSASGQSARSEYSLIEAFEHVISEIHGAFDTAGKARGESGYDKFKQWQQLWNTQNEPSADQNMGAVSVPTQQPSWGTMDAPSVPLFGIEGNFGSFPQTIDEFSSFFGCGLGRNSEMLHRPPET